MEDFWGFYFGGFSAEKYMLEPSVLIHYQVSFIEMTAYLHWKKMVVSEHFHVTACFCEDAIQASLYSRDIGLITEAL